MRFLMGLAVLFMLTGPVAADPAAVVGPSATTYAEQTENNTSACVAGSATSPTDCVAPFTGQVDTTAGIETPLFDPPGGNVSKEPIDPLIYPGSHTKVFVTEEMGFCTTPDGSSSPGVPRCNDNVMPQYTSDSVATVDAEIRDVASRGINGFVMDWYGGGSPVNDTTLKFESQIHQLGYCQGREGCRVKMVLMWDGSTLDYPVTPTGVPGTTGDACLPGSDESTEATCIVARLKNDLCYMNGTYFGNSAYETYNLDGTGPRPMLQFFIDEAGMFPNLPATGAAPSWSDIWSQVRLWANDLSNNCSVAPYNEKNNAPLFIFENTPGFSQAGANGAYDWILPLYDQPVSNQDQLGIAPASLDGTLDNFYQVSKSYSSGELVWGLAYKGFDSTQSAWGPNRVISQQCGRTWLDSLAAAGDYYSRADPLPFLQVGTWNEYNEGTEIESGISTCYNVTAAVQGSQLTWSLNASSPYATTRSIDHFVVFASTDGTSFHPVASLPAWQRHIPLGRLGPGAHYLFVKMVGKADFLNESSPVVTSNGA